MRTEPAGSGFGLRRRTEDEHGSCRVRCRVAGWASQGWFGSIGVCELVAQKRRVVFRPGDGGCTRAMSAGVPSAMAPVGRWLSLVVLGCEVDGVLPLRLWEGWRTNEQLAAGFGSSTRGRWWVQKRLGSEVEVEAEAEAEVEVGGVQLGVAGMVFRRIGHGSWIMDRG